MALQVVKINHILNRLLELIFLHISKRKYPKLPSFSYNLLFGTTSRVINVLLKISVVEKKNLPTIKNEKIFNIRMLYPMTALAVAEPTKNLEAREGGLLYRDR